MFAEVLELAGNAARDNKKMRIIPRHIVLAVLNDEELSKMCNNRRVNGSFSIAQGGYVASMCFPHPFSLRSDLYFPK